MMSTILAFLLLMFACDRIPSFVSSHSEPHEKRLAESLFKNYNPIVRPSKSPVEVVNITVSMYVESIAGVNDKEGTITISGWLAMNWRDFYLSWEPREFGNVSSIVIPAEKVWRPDMAFNSAVDGMFFSAKDLPVLVSSDGSVDFSPGGRSTHSCDLDMTLFPFDSQSCKFIVSTWYTSVIHIKLEAWDLTYDKNEENDIWKITDTHSEVSVEGIFANTQVVFTLHIQRKPLYCVLYVIFPLLMLALLNLMVFKLPTVCGEKISLSMTVLLAFSIWLIMLNDLTPNSSESIPILGIFITLLMLLSATSTVITVFVVRIHHCGTTQPIPSWVTHLVHGTKLHRNNKIHEVENGEDVTGRPPFAWKDFAIAADQLALLIVTSLTAIIIIACSISFLVLKTTAS